MKRFFFISICVLSLSSAVNAQQPTFEDITYKTKTESADNKTLLQKAFESKDKPKSIPAEQTITAKVIIKGKASLYEVNESPVKCNLAYGTKPFYFIKTDQGTFPLLHHEQTGTFTVNQPYKGMLTYCLQNWDGVQYAIDHYSYSAEGLRLIVEQYNKAVGGASK